MRICASCHRLVLDDEEPGGGVCPHCGRGSEERSRPAARLLVGVARAGLALLVVLTVALSLTGAIFLLLFAVTLLSVLALSYWRPPVAVWGLLLTVLVYAVVYGADLRR